ncbi:M3 family metallopeptidase [Mucilaginibacter polytrichastri]|uniref:Peptidase M3A/M3B catalytic domain-containing protein n=1 Tax=Mucilaginibacter polytrichastri TaxID=1302689 RepID=A0A1Q5ZSM5_9SPHI|nr:M3 family metallopeptidase [Mucilaginibacter polytrichastri]OKS84775.1 hypothetical protein RG47T_0208 [Mucilaginibacter polytrichastri]SFT00461.1 Peptidase family M3 [Mucilaginibacter polytrichastri]
MPSLNISLKKLYIIAACLLCLVTNNYAQQQFDPFEGNAPAFHANMVRYFKSPADELNSRKLLLDSVKTFQNDSVWTMANLLPHLNRYEKLLISLQKHYQYHRLLAYINNKDTLARKASNQTDEIQGELNSRVDKILLQPQFASLTDQQFSQYGVSKYKYLLKNTQQNAAHNLSPHDEKLANQLTGNMIDQLTDRYDNLMNEIKVTEISIDGKTYNWASYKPELAKTTDAKAHAVGLKAYYNAYYDAYSSHAEVFAATLIDITRQKNALAKLQGFTSTPERIYQRRLQLSETGVKQMLQQMTNHAGVLKAYKQLLMEQTQHTTGLSKVYSWDITAPAGYTWQSHTYAQARQLILKALAPLGDEYERNFANLLDPANGRLEIAGGPNRVTEFTSIGYSGIPIGLYMKTYDGGLKSTLVLAHEGGHAIHEQLMSDHATVPSYSSGPSFLFEAYAMFNELLMLDEMRKQASTPQAKAFFTKQFLDKLSLEVFTSAEEGTFEQGLYDGVATGKINTRRDIDSLYTGIMNQYDIYFAGEPQRRSEWINKRLVFDDPLYNVNYLYAILVSCKLYNMQHAYPKGFAMKYNVLLKNGFDAPAEDLLKKQMGFGLDNNALLNGTLQIMKDKTEELRHLYEKMK